MSRNKMLSWILICCFAIFLVPLQSMAIENADKYGLNFFNSKSDEKGMGWGWTQKTKTLSIKNLTLNVNGENGITALYGINLPKGSTLVVQGENNININCNEDTFFAYGLCAAYKDLTIKGPGTLNITISNSVKGLGFEGLRTCGDLKLNNVKLNFYFKNCKTSKYSMFSNGDNFNIILGKGSKNEINSPDAWLLGAANCNVNIKGAGSLVIKQPTEFAYDWVISAKNFTIQDGGIVQINCTAKAVVDCRSALIDNAIVIVEAGGKAFSASPKIKNKAVVATKTTDGMEYTLMKSGTISRDFTWDKGNTLIIPQDLKLTVVDKVTFKNNGVIKGDIVYASK